MSPPPLPPVAAAGLLLAVAPLAAAQTVLISEVAPASSTLADEEGAFEDWVELYNPTATQLSLDGYTVADDRDDASPWALPDGLAVPPFGFLVLWADDDEEDGPRHLDFSLKRGGESFVVRDPSGEVVDAVDFPAVPFRASYARDNGGGFFLSGAPSPGAPNNTATRYLAPPTASVPSGSYAGAQAVTLDSDVAGATITYTLDGSPPTPASTRYTGPVAVAASASLRAMATAPGYAPSRDETWAYLVDDPIGEGFDAILLTADPVRLFSDTAGIYVVGTNGVENYCADPGSPANYFQDWDVPANFQLVLGATGEVAFDVDGETQINGVCSRRNLQKALGLTLREKTYGDDVIAYDLFPTRGVQEYDRLKIRNGGQDWNRILMRDYVNQTLLAGQLDLDVQLGRPVLLYVNGDFFGIHNLREKYRPSYFAANYDDLDEDGLIVLKSPGTAYAEIKYGPDTLGFRSGTFDALQRWVEGADLTDDEAYARFAAAVDVDNLLTYFSVMTYLGNRDWPGNNLTAWRDLGDERSRWRFAVADTDVSSGTTLTDATGPDYNTLAEVLRDDCPFEVHCLSDATLFLRRALARPELLAEFVQRTNTLAARAYAPARARALIDAVEAIYAPYRERTWSRWDEQPFGMWVGAYPGFVDDFRAFYAERPAAFRGFMAEAFGIAGGTYRLTVGPSEGGGVALHTDLRPVEGGYVGEYFGEVPVLLTAVAEEGYAFERWLETGETDAAIELTSGADATRTPVFSRVSSASEAPEARFGVSPNPVRGVLRIAPAEAAALPGARYRVFTSVGREVLSAPTAAGAPVALDVSELPAGYYLVRRDGEAGAVAFVKK